MNKNLQALLKVVSSNFVVMILGIISTLVIPGILGPEEYGKWQLYLLYSSYVGIVILGFNDGIYLENGGKNYKELNFNKLSFNFIVMCIYTILVSIISIFYIHFFVNESSLRFILISVSIYIILQCVTSFFVLIHQATSRFTIFSLLNIIEKLIFTSAIFILLFADTLNFKIVISISIFSKIIVLLLNVLFNRELVFSKPEFSLKNFKELKIYILGGLPLTIAGISAMLINGVGRVNVELNFGIAEFGYYSFAFALLGIVTQLIAAASIVIYPVLSNISTKNILDISKLLEQIIDYGGALINFLYYPMVIFITFFLPEYNSAISIILILFPMLIYQSKITIIYNTIFKVIRLEKQIMINSIYTLIVTILLTYTFLKINETVLSITIATLLSYFFLSFISKKFLYKFINRRMKNKQLGILNNVTFISLNLLFPLNIGFILYVVYILIIIILKYTEIKKIISTIRQYL